MYQFLPNFEKAGLICAVKPLLTKEIKILQSKNSTTVIKILASFILLKNFLRRYIDVILSFRYDVVIVQKDVLPLGQLSLLKLFNKRIIYEFDDAIWQPNPATGESLISKLVFKYRRHSLQRILEKSTLVLAENSYLARYSRQFNQNVEIISAPIDIKKYSPAKKNGGRKGLVIGWLGSPTTKYLLESIERPLSEIGRKYPGICLHNIGGGEVSMKNILVKNIQWREEQEVSELRLFDIGLMPLDDSEFNKGRLGYKIIVYFAMGIPTIASDMALNKEVIKNNKNGFLVKDSSEWIAAIEMLITDKKLRENIGNQGRIEAENKYSLDICAKKYIRLIYHVAQAQ